MPDPVNVAESLGKIETNIEWIRDTLEHNCDWKKDANARMGKVEDRVSKLEQYRSVVVGGFALFTLLLSYGWLSPRF